jgi:hypothetical protein
MMSDLTAEEIASSLGFQNLHLSTEEQNQPMGGVKDGWLPPSPDGVVVCYGGDVESQQRGKDSNRDRRYG